MTKTEKEKFHQDQNNQFEFSIKLFPKKDLSMSESGSREPSIVRQQSENDEGEIEE